MTEHGGQFFALAQQLGYSHQHALAQLIDLSASINPVKPLVEQRFNPDLLRHYPPLDPADLRDALAKKFALRASQICVTNGISSAILSLFAHFRPAHTVLYTPIYSEYQRAAAIYSQQTTEISRLDNPTGLHQPVPKNAWVVWVNPSTPDGQYYSPEQLAPLVAHWRAQDCWVLVDESFLPFIGFESSWSFRGLLEDWPRLVILQSLTKYYACPGVRIGAVFAQSDTLNQWPQPSWPISTRDSDYLIQALQDSDFDRRSQAWLSDAKMDLVNQLSPHPLIEQVYPTDANFVLVKTRQPARPLSLGLQQQGILVRACDSFGLGECYLRIAVQTPAIHQRLIAGLNKADVTL